MFRGSEDHSDLSGLPGLQQQTQDTLSCYVLHVLTRLDINTQRRGEKLAEEATQARLRHNNNASVINVFKKSVKSGKDYMLSAKKLEILKY